MLDILFNAALGVIIYFAVISIVNRYRAQNYEEQEEQYTIPEDWILPLYLEYNKDTWYAWDKDGTFILQAEGKDKLLTDILNKYDIPPKRISIESEKQIEQ